MRVGFPWTRRGTDTGPRDACLNISHLVTPGVRASGEQLLYLDELIKRDRGLQEEVMINEYITNAERRPAAAAHDESQAKQRRKAEVPPSQQNFDSPQCIEVRDMTFADELRATP